MEAPARIQKSQPREVSYRTLSKLFFTSVRCLLTTKIDSSRAVVTRMLKSVQFEEKCIFPQISLLDTVAIYDLTTHARLPCCPKVRALGTDEEN